MTAGFQIQDTVKTKLVIHLNADRVLPDSVFRRFDEKPAYILKADSLRFARQKSYLSGINLQTDTTSVCTRNSVADVTFYDSLSFIRHFRFYPAGTNPFRFSEKSGSEYSEYRPPFFKNLRAGEEMPLTSFHNDWITILIIFSAWLFLYVRASGRNLRADLSRFFLFRGINEPASRDTGSLFYWQSTIMNFISFLVISIFGYFAASYYGILPSRFAPALAVAIIFGIIAAGITLRHFVCFATGNLSGKTEIFNEYLVQVYQSYRFGSFIIFAIILLMAYTVLCPPGVCITAGIVVLALFYSYRFLRLLLIFIKRDVSIFYLILYFCALEILPVMILLKFISGQF